MVLVVFLGLGLAQQERAHIRAELFISKTSKPVRRYFDLFAHLLGFLFWTAIAVTSFYKAYDSSVTGEYKEGLIKFPVWPVRWALAFGVLLLCLQLLIDIWATFQSKEAIEGGKG
jgi:TRAP-type C4-dicarboxylate transport system permease small subunit